ncbi:MAG: FeoB small GTPase domain-containing protein [Limnochordia bacterium]|jgi:ferrous iron transport protein B
MGSKLVVLIGHPNVGKSVIFNFFTGGRAQVSNYPGTTVEITRGRLIRGDLHLEFLDTPGIYSLCPLTAEEAITRRILWEAKPDLLIHVIDGKNLVRSLPLTFQLQETGLPLLLNMNMMDEAAKLGLSFDLNGLEKILGLKVIPTVSTKGQGMEQLLQQVMNHVNL